MNQKIQPPKIIGIIGKSGVGKDTLADLFVRNGYTKIAMADPLKYICKLIFHFSDASLWGPSEYRTPKVRKALQILGTDIARKLDPDVWIKLNNLRIDYFFEKKEDPFKRYKLNTNNKGLVFSDIRFPNEANYLHNKNSLLIKIKRRSTKQSKHASEKSVDLISKKIINYTIINNGTLNQLLDMYKNIAKAENVLS